MRQYYSGSDDLARLLGVFRRMLNDCISMGLSNDVVSLRKLSLLCYNRLSHYDSPSYYKLCAISRAAGILSARNKSLKRGLQTRSPYAIKPHLTVTRRIVAVAAERREAIVLENIESIRSLYRRGNGQARKYRGRMNGWSFAEAQRQIEYKARWIGLPVIRLSKRETRATSVTCPRCGERLQSERNLKRKLWCGRCRMVMDRDRVAAVNLARRGRLRFDRSQPTMMAQGLPGEAMVSEREPWKATLIRTVDGGKLTGTKLVPKS